MSVPKFTEFMTPMLEWLYDGESKHYKTFTPFAIKKLNISEEDQNILLNSGQPLFENRYGWARLFLKKAGLLEIPQRGYIKITDEGLKQFNSGKVIVSAGDLEVYEQYRLWKNQERSRDSLTEETPVIQDSSPEELIDKSFEILNGLLQSELLEKVKTITPSDFENLVVKLLTSMGYGGSLKDAGVVIGKSGDGGIDGIISEDRLGLSKIYIQAKRWEANVGDVEIGRFMGSLSSRGATKGVFITTSDYTRQAKETIERNRSSMEIVLISGVELAKLMIEYDLGVSVVSNYQVKKIDGDFFE